MSNGKNPGCYLLVGKIGDYTTQLHGFINHYKDPYETTSIMEKTWLKNGLKPPTSLKVIVALSWDDLRITDSTSESC